MAKLWCNETDCWFNHKCKCREKDVYIYDGECITCRYDKPEKGRCSRDPEDVRKDRAAKHVADAILSDMLERMRGELNPRA